ncbi:MAG TPA: PIN domain-containing protein [Candidatus Saccharimonadia bacterium]|nr:PIN domain-containing protein [Candidatus Saccharimonadia bacterium]
MTNTMVFSLAIIAILVVLLGVLRLRHISLQALILGVMGSIVGLVLGALASVPLSKLPEPLGSTLPMVVSVLFTIGAIVVVSSRRAAFLKLLPFLALDAKDKPTEASMSTTPVPAAVAVAAPGQILVDTSVIIDGRIADIAEAGFVPGVLVVPRFVLAELQNIADSDDAMRRGRGRRGLEVLNRLREMADVTVEITEEDAPNIKEVDAKLVALAQRFSCNVLTTDYNLNRVAQIQGVRVLNVNELSNAIRPVVLPGEELMVRVVQPGKERNQGVGYLADGTMIVVENGDKLMGQEVLTEVTRVFQTVAGKMIFATPRRTGGNDQPRGGHGRPQAQAAPAPAASPAAEAAAPASTPVAAPAPKAAEAVTPAAAEVVAAPPAAETAAHHGGSQRERGRQRGRDRRTSGGQAGQARSVDRAAGDRSAAAEPAQPLPLEPNQTHRPRPQQPQRTNDRHLPSSATLENRLVRQTQERQVRPAPVADSSDHSPDGQ